MPDRKTLFQQSKKYNSSILFDRSFTIRPKNNLEVYLNLTGNADKLTATILDNLDQQYPLNNALIPNGSLKDALFEVICQLKQQYKKDDSIWWLTFDDAYHVQLQQEILYDHTRDHGYAIEFSEIRKAKRFKYLYKVLIDMILLFERMGIALWDIEVTNIILDWLGDRYMQENDIDERKYCTKIINYYRTGEPALFLADLNADTRSVSKLISDMLITGKHIQGRYKALDNLIHEFIPLAESGFHLNLYGIPSEYEDSCDSFISPSEWFGVVWSFSDDMGEEIENYNSERFNNYDNVPFAYKQTIGHKDIINPDLIYDFFKLTDNFNDFIYGELNSITSR